MSIELAEMTFVVAFDDAPVRLAAPHRARAKTLRQQRRARIQGFIETNFSDADLCAPIAARALGMSVRSLHLTLAAHGESFNMVVRQRRLGACLALLRRPDRDESVADIAFACGFNSLSSFYRAFRQRVGACPRAPGCAGQAAELMGLGKGLLF